MQTVNKRGILCLEICLHFWGFYINEIIVCTFKIWLLSLSIYFAIHTCCCSTNSSFLFVAEWYQLQGYTIICLSIFLLMGIWDVHSFWLLQINLLQYLYTFLQEHMLSFLLYKFYCFFHLMSHMYYNHI